MPHRIIIINGPNINLLGEREKSQYGKLTFEELKNKCLSRSSNLKVEIEFYQSNIEGEIVTKIQESRNKFDGIITIVDVSLNHYFTRTKFRSNCR